jgi:hypothetical protein
MHGKQENGLSKPRRLVPAKLAAAVAAAALVAPAAAAGYAAPGDSGASTAPGQGGAPDRGGALVLHRDGSKAVPFVADVGVRDAATGDGFDWEDAMIGGGAVLGIAALGAAGLTLRRRTAVGAGSVATGS